MKGERWYILWLLVVVMVFATQRAYGVVAMPGSGWVGDEYFHYREGETPEVFPTRAQMAALRRLPDVKHSSYPTEGEPPGLVILVNFSDVKFVTSEPQKAFTRLLNESGYSENNGTGSARDYYIASSDSIFRPHFDVYGPYDLINPMSYYGAPKDQAHDSHVAQMVEEACVWAEDAGVNLAKYDTDNDGVIDNVFIYYAGYNQAEGGPENSIWPHRSRVVNAKKVCGKTISDYACTSELTGSRGKTMCGIGTFCHEFSHVLGLPDLYNTSSGSTYTVGTWDIMASGNYNNSGHTPPAYTAFERFMMGWIKPEQLNDPSDYELLPLETEAKAFLIAQEPHNLNPQNLIPAEFWLIENRQQVGWDKPSGALPGVGLLITHISHDEGKWKKNTYNNSEPLGFDVCEAYVAHPSKSSSSDTYPGSMNITSFTPTNDADEALREHLISSIHYINETDIVFHYGEVSGTGFNFEPQSVPTILTEYTDRELVYYPEPLHIFGEALEGDSVFISFSNTLFQISPDGAKWYNEFIDTVRADSTYSRQFYIRHQPPRQCSTSTGALHVRANNYLHHTQIILSGKATRALMIAPVASTAATHVTPYSFIANWEEQKDAELYYLSLYRLEEGTTVEDHLSEMRAFAGDGDSFETSILALSPASLDVTMSQTFLGESEDEGAEVIISAQASPNEDAPFVPIDTVTMRSISQTFTHSYTFAEDKTYYRFRFSYRHLGGEGTIRVTQCDVTYPRKIETIYDGEEHVIYAPTVQAQIADLEPDKEYLYRLVASENKGCELHVTSPGYSTRTKTLQGASDPEKHLTIYLTEQKTLIVFFPTVTKPNKKLILYDANGRRVQSFDVPENVFDVELETTELRLNTVYLLKYGSEDGDKESISRKDKWGKFLYW